MQGAGAPVDPTPLIPRHSLGGKCGNATPFFVECNKQTIESSNAATPHMHYGAPAAVCITEPLLLCAPTLRSPCCCVHPRYGAPTAVCTPIREPLLLCAPPLRSPYCCVHPQYIYSPMAAPEEVCNRQPQLCRHVRQQLLTFLAILFQPSVPFRHQHQCVDGSPHSSVVEPVSGGGPPAGGCTGKLGGKRAGWHVRERNEALSFGCCRSSNKGSSSIKQYFLWCWWNNNPPPMVWWRWQ
jgi:hypothetical protein